MINNLMIMIKKVEPLGVLIGQNVKRIRKNIFGWSQEKLADAYGCNKTYIAQVELGLKVPGASSRKKLAGVLKCDPADLLQPLDNDLAVGDTSPAYDCFSLDTGTISQVVEIVEIYFNKKKFKIAPARKGLLVAKIVEYVLTENTLPDDQIIKAYLQTV